MRIGAALEPAGVVVSVTDTGDGIAPETRERLFEPLFTTRAEGTGLGLFLCARLVREAGGELEVESEVGRGTRVRVVLRPARDPDPPGGGP